MPTEPQDAPRTRRATFLQTVGAVFWSFFGVRKRRDLEADMLQLNPVHIIIAAVAGAAIFVLTLIFIVRLVVQ